MADYKEAPLATRPKTLEPEYFNISPEYRRTEEERAALRSRLKRQYQLQLNNPHRKALIEDPALTRWTYARISNIYPNFKPTTKTSLIGGLFGVVPLFVLYFVLKTNRDTTEQKIKDGTYERPYRLSY